MKDLQEWVAAFGGTRKVADALGVSIHAVRHWIQRKGCPKVATMVELVRISKGELSLEMIIASSEPNPCLKNPRKLKRSKGVRR